MRRSRRAGLRAGAGRGLRGDGGPHRGAPDGAGHGGDGGGARGMTHGTAEEDPVTPQIGKSGISPKLFQLFWQPPYP